MKKGPLSKTEKEFLELNKNLMSMDELATKLERSISILNKYLQKNNNTTTAETDVTTTNTENPSDINLYARNKNRGVVVMTESASMAADQKRSSTDIYKSRKYRDVIHKIREE